MSIKTAKVQSGLRLLAERALPQDGEEQVENVVRPRC